MLCYHGSFPWESGELEWAARLQGAECELDGQGHPFISRQTQGSW